MLLPLHLQTTTRMNPSIRQSYKSKFRLLAGGRNQGGNTDLGEKPQPLSTQTGQEKSSFILHNHKNLRSIAKKMLIKVSPDQHPVLLY